MIRSILIGLVAGMRSMTPVAAVSMAAMRGLLPNDNGASSLLTEPTLAKATIVLAVGELVGDKLTFAPDRIIAPAIAARMVTGALAGAALAPSHRRSDAAVLGATAAVVGAYLSFAVRTRAIRKFGQGRTGLLEDLLAVGGALWLLKSARSANATAAVVLNEPR